MNPTIRALLTLVACWLALAFPATPRLLAGSDSPENCVRCGTSCARGQLIECTIMVPTTVVETRMQTCVVYTTEERTEEYTVFVRVPKERTYTKTYWYLDDAIETQEVVQERCQVVMNPVVREYNVQVPVRELRTITVPEGGCAQSGKPGGEVTCQQEVTVMRDEPRTCTTQEPQVVFETTKSWIDYCTKVPKAHEVECAKETVYELQPKTETRTVQVCVPKIEKRPVCVEVCKMLPQTIHCCAACAKHRR
jgi:hypothetical protein